MKKLLLFFFCLITILSNQAQTVTVTVNTAKKYQTITGMGAQWSHKMKNDLIYDIGISTARLWVGFGTGTYDEPVNDNGDPNTFDDSKVTDTLTVDEVAAIKEAISKGTSFFSCIGSPPVWLKDTNSPKMYWRLKTNPLESAAFRLRYDCGGEPKTDPTSVLEFGEYAYGIAHMFKKQTGTDMLAISIQNEPAFPEPYFSCIYSQSSMVANTKAVVDHLAAKGSPTKAICTELTANQPDNVRNWSAAVNNDASGKNVMAFAIHAYSEDPMGGGMALPVTWAQLYAEAQRVSPVKEVWQTEGGPGYNSMTSLIDIAIGGGIEFYKAMRFGNANLFAVYNFGRTEPARYYSIKNMIRYIRSGSYRVNALASDTANIMPLVFKHDAQNSTVVYVINNAKTNKTVKFAGLTGSFEAFQTTETLNCEWVGQYNLANDVVLPPMSITTMINCSVNKIPNINKLDTIVIIKNAATKSVDLTGINDGGEGNQTLSLKAWSVENGPVIFSNITTTYASPESTGKLNITPGADKTGNSIIYVSVRDNSTAMNGFFNEKVISVPVYIVPYINKAPTLMDIPNQKYEVNQINIAQIVNLIGVTDGNDGKQKLTLTAVSSNPAIATVTNQLTSALKITPLAQGTVTITVTLKDDGLTVGKGANSITKTFTVVVGSGIDLIDNEQTEDAVYPNPARDKITIVNKELKFDSFMLTDINGITLISGALKNENNTVSTAGIQAGVYFIKLINKKEIRTTKLVIE